jgi:hypothetical protein
MIMRTALALALGFLQAIFWTTPRLAAATTSGVISQNETWSDRVVLTGDVRVATNITLTILPGTRVEAAPGFDDTLGGEFPNTVELIVAGSLFAVGTEADPVVFTSAAEVPTFSDWRGIRVEGGSATLNRCMFSSAGAGVDLRSVKQSVIENCQFRNNGYGVVNSPGDETTFLNCTFELNKYSGVRVRGKAKLISSTLTGNGYGIDDGSGVATVELIDCAITDSGGLIANTAIVRDSVFSGNFIGITSGNASVTNSTFTSNWGGVQGAGVVVDCTFTNNSLGQWGNSTSAIQGAFEVFRCEIVGNGGDGVLDAKLISNCTINDNRGRGAVCETIVDSTIEGNGSTGLITMNASNCIVRDNGAGVNLYGVLARMENCRVESNADYGVWEGTYVYTRFGRTGYVITDEAQLEGCTITQNGGTGVVCPKSSFTISNCTITQNGFYGVMAGYRTNLTDVLGTTIAGSLIALNGEAGIRFGYTLEPGDYVGNVIQSNRVGILVDHPGQSPSDSGITSNHISDNIEFEVQNLSAGTVIADGNFWGEPTTTELNAAVVNLSRIYDAQDAPLSAGRVLIRTWSASPVFGGPVVIHEGMEDQSVRIGEDVLWTVVAEGADTYQWFKDGDALPGATTATLHLTQVEIADGGLYSLVAANDFASASSGPARLTVTEAPTNTPAILDLARYTGIAIYGTPGKSYRIDYATDPSTPSWVSLTNITISTNPAFFLDMESAWPAKRFYRAVELP